MENLSHSLPRRSSSFSNGGAFYASHNSVYDDVFGGPRKFDIPTLLAPRVDDYSEIFGASRSSSAIPFLHRPLTADQSNWSSAFDYTEVFGDFGAFAFTPSFHDLLAHGDDDNEEEDSSHEPWSPAQSGSVSDELDPLNGSDKSNRLSDVDAHHSLESKNQFNASYTETVFTNFCAVPGYTFSPCESSVSWNGEDEPLEKPFITVSDISLRTKPSRLPPPSRPPPALVLEKRECDRSNSKLKTSRSYALDDSASLFVDVEVDATVRENKNIKVKHESTKEETAVSVPVTEDMIGSTKETSGFGGVKYCDSADDISDVDVAWKEETEYFEVIEKNISRRQAFDMVEDYNTSTWLMNRMTNCDIFNQKGDGEKLKATKEAPKWDEERNQLEMTTDYCEQQERQNMRWIDQKEFQEDVKLSKLYDFDTTVPQNFQPQIDPSDENVEGRKESKGNVTALEAKLRLRASPKGMDIQRRPVDAQVIKQSSGKHKQERQRGHEDVKGVKKTPEPERDEKQHNLAKEDKERRLMMDSGKKQKVNELTFREALEQVRNEKDIKMFLKGEVTEERSIDASETKQNDLIFRLAETEAGDKREVFETKANASLSRGCSLQETKKIKDSEKRDQLLDGNTDSAANITIEFRSLHNQMRNSNNCANGNGVSRVMPEKKSSDVEQSHEPEKIISTEDEKMKTQVIRESLLKGRKVDDASSVLKRSDDSLENSTTKKIERKDKNIKDSIDTKDPKVEERVRRQTEVENEHMRKMEEERERERERVRRQTEVENEHMRKMEEEREREREREKDRMAVNKAALERSYVEARERAAVERATAEARQRAMAGARERLENTSMEAKLRFERAAVERANAEARQRAVEKSMVQKAASDTRHIVAEGESPQRSKARLERYRRTAERAANALAEKNRRDLLAQREREERTRVAESLDAELKRWSNGKEKNLRALLSTLQYILGPDSGWQPVPLTEIITTASVKKAYRKATLFVHPDKLQQRGATIQQKYICEKVFDLLKEAWNKFNSEER